MKFLLLIPPYLAICSLIGRFLRYRNLRITREEK